MKIKTLKEQLKGIITEDDKKYMRCENCGRLMKEFDGKYGKFMGCPNYFQEEKCRKTVSLYK